MGHISISEGEGVDYGQLNGPIGQGIVSLLPKEITPMFVWEMIACRLRGEGWSLWHARSQDDDDWTYTVHFQRPGFAGEASGPTLTEAYAEAARRANASRTPARARVIPLFSLVAASG
jgi:hypothetical protein